MFHHKSIIAMRATMNLFHAKIYLIILIGLILSSGIAKAQGGVGINETDAQADPSAALDVNSTTKGTLITRMTTNQRNAISNPAIGLMVFNLDTKCVNIWLGSN